jgi:imidazole glycerol-phosphate synthase subunit HisH
MNNTSQITLIDAGTGNLRSVYKALQHSDVHVRLTDSAEDVRHAAKIVLPGVGAFGDFMNGMRAKNLDQAVIEAVRRGVPLLGICVGMQALFEVGEEMGEHAGLGLLEGRVVQFDLPAEFKVPQTGWNQLWFQSPQRLFAGLKEGAYVYFNHSYYCVPTHNEDITALTDYGINFASAVQHENISGVQFHPEKSQQNGLQILENFVLND